MEEKISPLTIARRLLPLCLALVLTQTYIWTALVGWEEVANGNHASARETVIAIGTTASPTVMLIVVISIGEAILLDSVWGIIMVTAGYLTNKFVKPLIERHKEEGRVEGITAGREEGIAVGEAKGREEGIAVGEAKGREEGESAANRRWTEWNSRRIEAERAGVPFDEPPPAP